MKNNGKPLDIQSGKGREKKTFPYPITTTTTTNNNKLLLNKLN